MTRARANTGGASGPAGLLLSLCAALALLTATARGQILLDQHPAETAGADVVDRRGEQAPMDAQFTGSRGETIRFGDLFDGKKPVVLILGYYDCPLLCNVVFNAAQRAFNDVEYRIGEDYSVVSISIDHTNTTAEAFTRELAMTAGLAREAPEGAWRFLTSDAANVRRLADAVGFKYVYMPKADEYAHASALILLTPDGKVSSYLFGELYPPKQLKLALLKASGGEMGSVFDKLIMHFCYVYDPTSGSYTLQAMRVMQLAAAGCALLLGGFIGVLFWQGRARDRRRAVCCGGGCGCASRTSVAVHGRDLNEAG